MRDEVFRVAGDAVFVRAVVDDGFMAGEIVPRRRRRNGPFESSRAPRINFRALAELETPQKIEQENKLRGDGGKGYPGNELLHGEQIFEVGHAGEVGVTARVPGHAQEVHGHENQIDARESDGEMKFAQALAHHAPVHLREPVIGGGEDSEDGGHAHDQVEMGNDEIGIVQRQVQRGLREEES